ncbi:bifunctional DNA primase/polymerase [Actinomadura terrae]|uniref:bifunctional DNA primase/polymerase n=1 Tax=Actinomadura terrae TaxID=604353 RepID=UPI001FA7741C|nr:bifunctional DNA primase/polymerase [Actinomadura terrae]
MTAGPYAQAYDPYRRAGWTGVLPLPAHRKKPVPRGWTGSGGAWPSFADCAAWADGPEGAGNIALRLPPGVIGVDVDNYDAKAGAATLADAEARWGVLPATWRTTSRDDGVSGIRLYRVPEGLAWPGELGADVELIHAGYRYAVVWPSVHPEGRTYRWISPSGLTSTAVPDPDQFPPLPDAWVEGLTHGQTAEAMPRNALADDTARAWILTRPGATTEPCARMARAIDQARHDLTGPGSAHNAARDAALRAVRLADEGHAGLLQALTVAHGAFVANATRPDRAGAVRFPSEAAREWAALVTSAVNLVSANPTGQTSCDCAGQLTGLIVSGAHPITVGATALTPPQPDPTRPPPDPTPQTSPEPDQTRSRTSWWPRNLAGVIAGQEDEPPPAVLARADGARLFYTGKVNAILGESESGKTWVLLLAVAQTLAAGRTVTYLDFEDTAAGIIGRLRALGVPDTDLTRLHYIGPDETLHATASDDLREHLDAVEADLIGLDGVNAAMTLLGLDLEKNKDATAFAQLLLKPLARAGGAVVMVDHVPKHKEGRGKGGIGAQAKRAMMDGCALSVEVVEPFGRGMTGRLRITVDKDRPGHVRAVSKDARYVGMAVLASDAETGAVTVAIHGPDLAIPGPDKAAGERLMLMEAISDHLFENPPKTSVSGIALALSRRKEDVAAALDELVGRGYVDREGTARGRGFAHTLARRYFVADDLTTPEPSDQDRNHSEPPGTTPEPPGNHSRNHGAGPRSSGSGSGDTPRRGVSSGNHSGRALPEPPSRDTVDLVDGRRIDTRTGEDLGPAFTPSGTTT